MAKTRVVQFRATEEEWLLFNKAADLRQRTVSDWARATLRARAKKLVEDNG